MLRTRSIFKSNNPNSLGIYLVRIRLFTAGYDVNLCGVDENVTPDPDEIYIHVHDNRHPRIENKDDPQPARCEVTIYQDEATRMEMTVVYFLPFPGVGMGLCGVKGSVFFLRW